VPHDADWTYSLAFPPSHAWYSLRAAQSYLAVHQWIHRSFAFLGVRTQLAVSEDKPAPGRCFIGAEKFDLLREGAKIAGAAQRRNRSGLLIQGSIQPGTCKHSREDWEKAMCAPGNLPGDIQFESLAWGDAPASRAKTLAAEKYSRPEYNARR
jgi:lipoate-protein ligase A